MKTTYIYVLKCPEGNIRYVGKTNSPKKRLSSHISEAKKGKGRRHVLNWVHSLLSKSLIPSMEIIEVCTEENWQEREKYWVEYYRNIIPNLCNNADGGLGGTGTKNFSKEELLKKKKVMSNTFSKFTKQDKEIIWSMIKDNKTQLEITEKYPKYTRHIDFGVRTGRQWKDITNINKIVYTNSKRIGYTCRNGLYMVRIKNDKSQKVIFSSKNEQDVINYLKDNKKLLA